MSHFSPIPFQQLITDLQIKYSVAEFHGFLAGLIAGGIQDESWKTLTYQFTHDGHSFSQVPLAKLTEYYQQLSQGFGDGDPCFALWLPSRKEGFVLADAIAEWTNHFLLGLGLAQPKLEQESDEVMEAVEDLAEIAKLGYELDDNPEELLVAGEEIVEYLRVLALFLHHHFARHTNPQHSQIH